MQLVSNIVAGFEWYRKIEQVDLVISCHRQSVKTVLQERLQSEKLKKCF